MKTRAELKEMAKEQIRGKLGILFLIALIIFGISFLAGFVLALIPGGGLVASIIITPAFSISLIRVYLNLANGVTPEAKDSFSGFDDFWSAFKVTFLVGLFTFLWSLLFVIPGIIKAFSYSQAMNIVAENKGMSALEAINRSKAMMEGHKLDLFILLLSFIGWEILASFTFGILYIWLLPYMQATMINFYNDLKTLNPIGQPAPAEYQPATAPTVEQ